MADRPLTIWCNAAFKEPVLAMLRAGLGRHRLVMSQTLHASNLAGGGEDPLLAEADVAFGQPNAGQVAQLDRLRWVHLTTAGYTRYDNDAVRGAVRKRSAVLTTSSSVYEEPCAEHLLSFILASARQLPDCYREQDSDRAWRQAHHRIRSRLLIGQTALLYGYGTIATRLAELLAPLRMNLIGVRRTVRGDEPIRMVSLEQADSVLPQADHVVNILPSNAEADGYFDARRFGLMKPSAIYYNIGRGTTVDQTALLGALTERRIAAAYLDVTEPEPLPPSHPLWTAPNCHITPHTAGGHDTEFQRLVEHFLANLNRFERGEALRDRVI